MSRGYRSRKRRIREPKNTFVIVCEGVKTEVNYFNGFRTRYSDVKIESIHGKCTDPKNIVEYAKDQISYWGLNFIEGDAIWCAFDVDENTTDDIKNAIIKAEKYGIKIALSNPSIELWFLLHFKHVTAKITRKDALIELKKFIKDYEKNMPVYDLLKEMMPTAITNAINLNKLHEKDRTLLFSRESNPSTQVFLLVESIHELIKNNLARR